MLETDPPAIIAQAWSYLRLLDRQRVNDAVKAVLAPLATGEDLDNIVARQNIWRLITVPATPTQPAVYETDAQLLRRYLLSFDRPAAGSIDCYLFQAFTAFPLMHDAAVLGRAIHGRRGDTDVVIAGPAGRDATDEEVEAVRVAVTRTDVKPEATSVTVVRATRALYSVSLQIEVPKGPDAGLVVAEATARVRAVADERTLIGAEVPLELLVGAAYGPNVLRVNRLSPAADLAPEPYTIPVCQAVAISAEVRA